MPYVAVSGLHVRDFEDGTLVFDPKSWDAHVLNPAAAALLDGCMAGPTAVSDAEALMREVLLRSEQGEASAHAVRVLRELADLGLIAEMTADARS